MSNINWSLFPADGILELETISKYSFVLTPNLAEGARERTTSRLSISARRVLISHYHAFTVRANLELRDGQFIRKKERVWADEFENYSGHSDPEGG